MRKQYQTDISSTNEREILYRDFKKQSKQNVVLEQPVKSNLSKTLDSDIEDQRVFNANSMRFNTQPEDFGSLTTDATIQTNQRPGTNTSALNRPITPPSDVQYVISQIKEPKDIAGAVEGYEIRTKGLSKEEVLHQENSKVKRFKNCLFFGQVVNDKRHGKGVMIYVDGRIYEGEWENDTKHGKGLEICPNGDRYDGHYLNGKPDGLGIFTWRNGEFYDGEWRNGMKHGSGMWRALKGESYFGEWKLGKEDGHGLHIWRNGDRYEGELKNCLKHGHGTEKFINGDYYVGNYVNGKPDGYGEYYWANGCQYKGFFKNGLRYGKGAWRKGAGNSDRYEGEWANDKKSGFGMYTWKSGNVYKGSYSEDLRHGYGEMFWTDGTIYKGQWEYGIQNGEGELSEPGFPLKKGLFQNNIFVGESDDFNDNNISIRLATDPTFEKGKPKRLTPINHAVFQDSYKKIIRLNDFSPKTTHKTSPKHDKSFQNDTLQYEFERKTLKQLDQGSSRGRSTGSRDTKLRSPKGKQLINHTAHSQSPETNNVSLPPIGGWLTTKEIAKWGIVKEKLGINTKPYDNLQDEKTVEKIREFIYPKVWYYWPKAISIKGKNNKFNLQQVGTAHQFYHLAH